uniref:Uncharacterized protein n=1 Tax=Aegilops tauschii subsp. strangulata TaxID=200361 RepID=A0A453GUJ0_AEGTS
MSQKAEVELEGVGTFLAEVAVELHPGLGERLLLGAVVGAALQHPVDGPEDGLPPLGLEVHHPHRPLERLGVGGLWTVAGEHGNGLRHGLLPQLQVLVPNGDFAVAGGEDEVDLDVATIMSEERADLLLVHQAGLLLERLGVDGGFRARGRSGCHAGLLLRQRLVVNRCGDSAVAAEGQGKHEEEEAEGGHGESRRLG